MILSPYPRRGHRIAPRTLRPILDVNVPKELLGRRTESKTKLYDLDESYWERFDPDTCQALARAVVAQVARSIPSLPESVAETRLPEPPEGAELHDLELTRRTHNSLKRAGHMRSIKALTSLKIGDVLAVSSFGAVSLVDLLTSLESLDRPLDEAPRGSAQMAKLIVEHATHLAALPDGDQIHKDDLRLGFYVRRVDNRAKTAHDLAERLIASKGKHPEPRVAVTMLNELEERIKGFKKQRLESELTEFMPPVRNPRKRRILARRYGWDARGGATLKVVGDEFDLTRERVRQICDRMVSHLSERPVYMPAFDRVVDFVMERMPSPASALEKELVDQGLTEGLFRLDGLAQTAPLFNRDLPFDVVEIEDTRLVVPAEWSELVAPTLQTARWCVQHWGLSTVAEVAARVQQDYELNVSHDFVTELLDASRDCVWLDREHGWFSLHSVGRNPLRKWLMKLLSVAPKVSTAELRSAASRRYRGKGLAPPVNVLLAFARQFMDYRVKGGLVTAEPTPDPRKTLSESERVMLSIFRKSGPTMLKDAFRKACMARGLDANIYWSNVMKSPVVMEHPGGRYGLPGISKAKPVDKSRSQVEYAWRPKGRSWLTRELDEQMVAGGRLPLPAELSGALRGRYQLQTEDGQSLGTIVVTAGEVRGLEPLFHRRGGEPGDIVSLIFDRNKHVALARLRIAGSAIRNPA